MLSTDAAAFCPDFTILAVSEKVTDEENLEALKLGHRLVHGVAKDIEALQFNTAIAKMMEFLNDMAKLPSHPKSVIKMAAQALMPFAPHLAEEIWQILGCKESLSTRPYPEVNPRYLEDDTMTYVIQINGKLRGRFELPKDQTQDVVMKAALDNPHIAKFVDGTEIVKVVFVPNKLLNLVVK